jgi:cytochrome P450
MLAKKPATIGGLEMSSKAIDQNQEALNFPMARQNPFNLPEEYTRSRSLPGMMKVTMWNGDRVYLASRYEDIRFVLGSASFSSVPTRQGFPFISESMKGLLTKERPSLTLMDGEEHLRQRRMLARMFTVGRIRKLREPIQEMVDEELDRLIAKGGPADFYEDFSLIVPSKAISVLLGVPYEKHEFFQEVARDRMNLKAGPEVPIRAGELLGTFLRDMLNEMLLQEDPGDHLMAVMVKDQIRPGNLDLEDAVSICRNLLIAGHETTANAITFSLLTLLQNPEQLQMLREDPSLMPSAVEELLRYTAVAHFTGTRVAVEDVQVGGQLVRAGEGVLAFPATANRDPAQFPNPDTLDLRREDNAHVTFADGIHQCLGQPLARLEMEVAIGTILRRMPNLSLAVPVSELQFRDFERAYGVYHLPLVW